MLPPRSVFLLVDPAAPAIDGDWARQHRFDDYSPLLAIKACSSTLRLAATWVMQLLHTSQMGGKGL